MFTIKEEDQSLFILGIGVPATILVSYSLIAIILGLFRKIVYSFFKLRSPHQSDQKYDKSLQETIARLSKRSKEKLHISDHVLKTLVIKAPVIWKRKDLNTNDISWRVGRDGKARFGVYRVLVMHLTDAYLGIFSCYYNLKNGTITNESIKQHQYSDIVSVSLSEFGDDVVLTLRSGNEVKTRRQFRIVFKNNEKITITVNAHSISEEVGIDGHLPEKEVEDVVNILNSFLRERSPRHSW